MKSKVVYLAKIPLYTKEKPYDIDFPVDDTPGASQTNHVNEERPVEIHEINDPQYWDLNVHGFSVINAETHIDPVDAFTRKREIQKDYWYQIEAMMHKAFPEYTRIECYDCTIRKRDPTFPESTTIYTNYEQPARRPHSDCSQLGGFRNMERAFPGQKEHWEGKDFDILNVWRPLVGPNQDWPLSICDWTTIDADNDLILNDALRRDRVDENTLMHYNEKHRWYYIKDQNVNDHLVFRNTDSFGKRPQGLHCSVFDPKSTGEPRQSVEVRLVAFRK